MYISRVALNVARGEARRLLSSPYRMHAAVEAAFPPGATRMSDQGRILWRVDCGNEAKEGTWLYVVSPDRPDFTHVIEVAGWPTADNSWETKNYDALLDRLEAGQAWAFRLKGNTVRKVREDKSSTPNERVIGTIQGHVTVDQQKEWLIERATKHGFSISDDDFGEPSLMVSHREKERFDKGGQTVTLSTAVFDGILRVEDPVSFREALCRGIGRAKGFGCGMLTVAPCAED